VSEPERFPFVQLEFAGALGLDQGRYLAREPERVLVVAVADAPPAPRRRLRRPRPQDIDPDAPPRALPLTTITVVRPEPLGDQVDAERWFAGVRDDTDELEAELEAALKVLNRALHAHRTAALDPAVPDASPEHALAVRLGYGTGEGLSRGRWEEAVALPASARRGRGEALRPQERVAAVLGRRESVPPHEVLLLRARADLDAGRDREAALQLRVGLEGLLADLEGGSPKHVEEVAALRERRSGTGQAANDALRGELTEQRKAELAETLHLCERLLRRRQAYRSNPTGAPLGFDASAEGPG
jgi:hypothetical protein